MANSALSVWSDDLIARLEKLWAAGRSTSQIAAELGNVTRNAVIGKVHRLGLNRCKAKRKLAAQEPNRRNNRAIKKIWRGPPKIKREPYVVAEPVDIVPRHLTVLKLGPNDCRYPYGDWPITFCGHPSVPGKSYCAAHCRLVFAPVQDRNRAPIYRGTPQSRFGGRAA